MIHLQVEHINKKRHAFWNWKSMGEIWIVDETLRNPLLVFKICNIFISDEESHSSDGVEWQVKTIIPDFGDC